MSQMTQAVPARISVAGRRSPMTAATGRPSVIENPKSPWRMPLSPPGSSIVTPASSIVPPGSALIRNGLSPQTPSHWQYWTGSGSSRPQRCLKAAICAAVMRGFCAKRASGPPGAISRIA